MSDFALTSGANAAALPGAWVDRLWARSRTRDAVLVTAAAGITAASAQVAFPIPGSPVPVTLQTFAVLLTAASLGAGRGVLGQILYVFLGAVGLPVFTGASGGMHVLVGATGGYLIGFILAAWLVGRWVDVRRVDRPMGTLAAYVGGTLVIYACGVTGLAIYSGQGLGWAISKGVVPFLLGDAFKALLAAGLLPLAWKAVRGREHDPR